MVFTQGASTSFSITMEDEGSDMVDPKNLIALVVDDDPVIRILHDLHLKSFGLRTRVVENGKEAVDLYRLGLSFNLIFIDKEMPVMDGVEATKALRALGVKSIIVGVTSHGLPEEIEAFMEAGLDYFFEKPLTAENISFILQNLNNN